LLEKAPTAILRDVSGGTDILVGDVGGTHARFAVVDTSGPPPWRTRDRLDLADGFPTFIDALRSYFERSRAK
jgi:glucokinase